MRAATWGRLVAFTGLVFGVWSCPNNNLADQGQQQEACADVTKAVNDFNQAFSSYPGNTTAAMASMDAGIAQLTLAIDLAESGHASTTFKNDLADAKSVAQGVKNAIANSQTPNWTGLNIATSDLGNDCSQILGGVTTP
jgi:hypothetical protein